MREFRCIVFNEHDVATAVIERRRSAGIKLPSGTLREVVYKDQDRKRVQAWILIVDDYGKEERVVIPHIELSAALVGYCLNHHIMIPNSSRRWVELINVRDLALFMTVDHKAKAEVAKRPAPAGGAAAGIGRSRRGSAAWRGRTD